jgi:hypothetical protein
LDPPASDIGGVLPIVLHDRGIRSNPRPIKGADDIIEILELARGTRGKDGRRKFEKFLREVGELDDEDDVIDVESK